VGAGTVEFIVEQRETAGAPEMHFYFMEMNTRLQVEHPVTEAITGLDLVAWQLQVAAGERLPLLQADIPLRGHAIEARICAENPDKQFLPATGRLKVYRKPAATAFEVGAVRVDDGVREGDTISPFYDSMVAKLIVHGDTREQALARLDAALAQTHVVGPSTNVQFLRHVVRSPSFAGAVLDTALITREADRLFDQDPVGPVWAVVVATAHLVATERQRAGTDPYSRTDGWRSHGTWTRHLVWQHNSGPVPAALTYGHAGDLSLVVGEGSAAVTGVLQVSAHPQGWDITWGSQRGVAQVYTDGDRRHVFTPQGAATLQWNDPLAHAGDQEAEVGGLTAPMPGKVVSVLVRVGDRVQAGQALAVMEAMKMEHTIVAPKAGEVTALLYAPGDQVPEGAALLQLS
jgi:3-methylcrotonyl-CoA carboxylase alpha subunit